MTPSHRRAGAGIFNSGWRVKGWGDRKEMIKIVLFFSKGGPMLKATDGH
jgi:hypothetical protein